MKTTRVPVLLLASALASAEPRAELLDAARCTPAPDRIAVVPVPESLLGYRQDADFSAPMKLVLERAGEYGEIAIDCSYAIINQPTGIEDRGINVQQMRVDLAKADVALKGLRDIVAHPAMLSGPGVNAMFLHGQLASAKVLYREAGQRTALLSNQYGLYAGLAYSLDAAGALIPGAEVLFRFDNEASRPRICPQALQLLWCRRFTEMSYQLIAAVDVPQVADASSPASPPPPGNPDPATATTTQADNPFIDQGGYFRFNTGVKAHFYDWIGFAAGVGVSSRPGDVGGHMRFKPRIFAGLSGLTVHGDGAQSQIVIGYAYDEFWERRKFRNPLNPGEGDEPAGEFQRVFLDGMLMIPGLRPAGFSVAARVWLDSPADFGDSPSEARASILFYQDFSGWTTLFGPLRALSAPLESL